jgi:probable poly-beta-1,6-N-acetyl-D-glucosamine export protein
MFKRLLQLNGLAIIAVIIFHAAGWGYVAMFAWAGRYAPFVPLDYVASSTASYIGLRVMEQIAVFAIPAFLFVSGLFMAFAAGRQGKTVSRPVIQARIRTMLIPYLLWSTLLLTLSAAEGHILSPTGYLVAFLTGKANPAYYYVPLIIQFYLLSPYLVPLAKNRPRLLLGITALIQLAVHATYYPELLGFNVPILQTATLLLPKWLFVTRIFWFSAGIVAGFNLKLLEERLPPFRWHLLGASVFLFILGVIEWLALTPSPEVSWVEHRETFVDSFYAIAVILTILAFYRQTLPSDSVLGQLGARSFGIYLIHSPVMGYAARAIYHVAPQLLAHQTIIQPVLIILGLGVPLALMAFTNRTRARRIYKYSFG